MATSQPGRYYAMGYAEEADSITEIWTPWELEAAKADALGTVQVRLDAALDTRATIPCAGFAAGIVYDRNALINAAGLAAGDVYIDAADSLHTLTAEDVAAIVTALKGYRQGLYAAATQTRAAIAAAETVDDLPQD